MAAATGNVFIVKNTVAVTNSVRAGIQMALVQDLE